MGFFWQEYWTGLSFSFPGDLPHPGIKPVSCMGRWILYRWTVGEALFSLLVVPCCAKLLQLCPALCNPMNCSLPGSFVHGILQARILEWIAIPFSRESSWLTSLRSNLHWQAGSWPLAPPGEVSLGRVHSLYLILFDMMANGIVSLISLSHISLLSSNLLNWTFTACWGQI